MNKHGNCFLGIRHVRAQSGTWHSFAQRMLMLLLLMGALILAQPMRADAYRVPSEAPDANHATSVTFTLPAPFQVRGGEKMRLYRVGEYDGDTWKPVGVYQGYSIVLDMTSETKIKNLADTLLGYIQRDGLQADAEKAWPKEGSLSFSSEADGLKQGLYLGLSDPIGSEGHRYISAPFLVFVPGLSDDDPGVWQYQNQINLKGEPEEKKEQTIEVFKVWKDDNAADRPKQVVVQLLKNGVAVKEVVLEASNHWRYRWEHLSAGADWRVVEKTVPQGYHVEVSTVPQGVEKATVITNSKTPPPGTPPEPPKTPPHLTQTGISRLPIVVLTFSGFVLLLVSLVLRKKSR